MNRIFAILIFVIGFSSLFVGAGSLFLEDHSEDQKKQVKAIFQEKDTENLISESFIDEYFKSRKQDKLVAIAILILAGITTIIVSAGIWLKKEWARISWLVLISILVIAYLPLSKSLMKTFERDDWINMTVMILIGVVSWIYFCRPKTRTMFKEKT